MGQQKEPGTVEPEPPAKKQNTLQETVKQEGDLQPVTPVEGHSAPSTPSTINHSAGLKQMLAWLNYKADPQKNKSGELLADSQQALEACFLNVVLFDRG